MALKILLADDNITAQRLGAKILADAGHQVVAVSNGAAAVKKIASERPDLLILDVYMPGYSGLEVCAKVKGAPDTAGLPVLLSVTSMEPFSPEEGNQARADGVMIKPFIASDLLAVIEKFERKLHAAAPPAAPAPAPSPAIEHDASYEEWKAEAAPEEEPQPAPVEVPHEMAVAPVLGVDEMPVTPAPTHPAVVAAAAATAPAEFGVEPVAFEAPAPVFGEAEAAHPAFEVTAEPVLPSEPAPARAAIETEYEITPPAELEYTAAQVGEIEVAPAPELELTIEEPSAEEPVITQDPDLVTTPEEMAKFTTVFGTDKPEETPEDIVSAEPAAEATVEPESEVAAPPAEPVAEAGVDTVRLDVVPEALAEPEAETQPAAEAGVDTVRLETLTGVLAEPQPPEPIPVAETLPEPKPQPAPIAVAEALPKPQPVQAAPPDEIEIEMEEALQPAFAVSASAAAVAPAREPEPQVAAEPSPDEAADLVARFEAELNAQAPPEPESPAQPEFEAEPPAAAALPAAAAVDQERLAADVSAVLDRYLAGLKQEMVAAIVRELKK